MKQRKSTGEHMNINRVKYNIQSSIRPEDGAVVKFRRIHPHEYGISEHWSSYLEIMLAMSTYGEFIIDTFDKEFGELDSKDTELDIVEFMMLADERLVLAVRHKHPDGALDKVIIFEDQIQIDNWNESEVLVAKVMTWEEYTKSEYFGNY